MAQVSTGGVVKLMGEAIARQHAVQAAAKAAGQATKAPAPAPEPKAAGK